MSMKKQIEVRAHDFPCKFPVQPNRPLLPLWHQDAKKGQEHELLAPLGPMLARGHSTTIILGVRPLNLGLPLPGRSDVVLGAIGDGEAHVNHHGLLALTNLLAVSYTHLTLPTNREV